MKLTLKIKLLPTDEQADALVETMIETNACCNAISDVAWEEKTFQQFRLHKRVYYPMKESFDLSSQVLIRCISKVADSYKKDKKTKRDFKSLGGITYDNRILTYKPNNIVSIWTVNGREKMPFICHNKKYLPYIQGESDLVYKKGKFFLMQTVDVPDKDIENVEEFIGVDFGLLSIASSSDGFQHSSDELVKYRKKRQKVRSSIQRKGTRSSRRLLKRLAGKERTHGSIINHTISKNIVKKAKDQKKGIAIEDLKGIRFSANKKGKRFRSAVGKWSFYQLRQFLAYKSALAGVPLVVVPPAYTSKTCSQCLRIGNRKRKRFTCNNCGAVSDADVNAAKNIARWGLSINRPGESTMFCSLHSLSGSKPRSSAA